MPYVNKVILVGELSADAEGRSRPNSTDVIANLRVETRERFPDRVTGEMREVSDYHRVVVFGRLAEQARSLKKGTWVSVEGRSRTRKYQANDGSDRYITEINAEKLDFDLALPGNNVSGRGDHSPDTVHSGNGEPPHDDDPLGPPY
jgi:single-strand DNA-binding protein